MKIGSAKQKGRRACQELKELILQKFNTELEADDILVASSSVCGEDLVLSPKARALLPYQFEVKNQEKVNIWAAIEQAKTHGSHNPVVAFKRNHSDLYVIVSATHFLELCAKLPRPDKCLS